MSPDDVQQQLTAIRRTLAEIGMAVDTGPCDKHRGDHGGHGGHGGHGPGAGAVIDVVPMLGGPMSLFLPKQIEDRAIDQPVKDCLHMLLSLVLDLWRRNEYLYLALKGFVDAADPADNALAEQTAMIADHGQRLDAFDQMEPVPWRDRAKKASAIVHRLLAETEDHHEQALERVGGSKQDEISRREEAEIAKYEQ